MAKCNVGFANIVVHTKTGAMHKKANDIWQQSMKRMTRATAWGMFM